MKGERIRLGNLRENWVVFLLILPTILGVGIFRYTPAFEAVRHSLYRWDGSYIEEFIGVENFRRLLGDLRIWIPLLLGGITCGISGLVDRKQVKRILRSIGTVCLIWAAVMLVDDAIADKRSIGSLVVLIVMASIGVMCWVPAWKKKKKTRVRSLLRFLSYFMPILAMIFYLVKIDNKGDKLLWMSFNLIFIMIVANLFKMWPSIFAAVCIHRIKSEKWKYFYRVLFVVPMIIPHMVGLLIWKFFYDPNQGVLNPLLIKTGLHHVLIWLDKWVLHLGVFNYPFKPAWLGDPNLVIPSLLFWGFPWVGVVGVLIYLAGLQNISEDVYEAAELDGIGWWGKFWYIELPLIMTQVRLNLILMIIGTLQAYGFQLILLGPEGGPQNKGLTPGLYMYFQAFIQQNFGYACAIGMMLFGLIMILTIVNQRYVRVDK